MPCTASIISAGQKKLPTSPFMDNSFHHLTLKTHLIRPVKIPPGTLLPRAASDKLSLSTCYVVIKGND